MKDEHAVAPPVIDAGAGPADAAGAPSRLLIGGEWREGRGGTFPVEDPATGLAIATVANGDRADADDAVAAATDAWHAWRQVPPRARADVLCGTYELMLERRAELVDLVVSENGKSMADARAEIAYAAEFMRWYAEEAVRSDGTYGAAPAGTSRTLVTRHPVGVAALVTPWNFPAAMATRKIAPALAAGCTVVLKPAAETPLTALAIGRLLAEAGSPAGVVNVVPTTAAAEVVFAWLADPRVRKLSFTGSTAVGKLLLEQASRQVLNCSMELGGSAPFIVTADADLDAAVEGAMTAKFRNGGQACTAANSLFVHRAVVEEFTRLLIQRIARLRIGLAVAGADIGPLISARAVHELEGAVEAAVQAGARVAHGGRLPDGPGYFFPPTVLSGVDLRAPITRRELFGPVAPIAAWDDEDTLVAVLNDSELGLAGYVYAGRLQDAVRIAERLEVGMVGLNRGMVSDPSAPFGGMKQSGLGREGARDGLLEFQETQYLSVDWP